METMNAVSVGFIPIEYGSYPTYEEWKLKCDLDTFLTMYVLILPMRNGNLNNRSNY